MIRSDYDDDTEAQIYHHGQVLYKGGTREVGSRKVGFTREGMEGDRKK